MSQLVLRLAGNTLTGMAIDLAGRRHRVLGEATCETSADFLASLIRMPEKAPAVPEAAVLVVDADVDASPSRLKLPRGAVDRSLLPRWLSLVVRLPSGDEPMQVLFDNRPDPGLPRAALVVELKPDTVQTRQIVVQGGKCMALGHESERLLLGADLSAPHPLSTELGLHQEFHGDIEAYFALLEKYLSHVVMALGPNAVVVLAGLSPALHDALPEVFMRALALTRLDIRFVVWPSGGFAMTADGMLASSLLF